MNFPCRIRDLFPVDLGIDLKAMQPEIIQCKRRFQKDLWNTICNRVLQEQSSWKKDDEKSGSGGGGKKGGGGGGGSGTASKETKSKSDEKAEESGGGDGGGGGGESGEDKPEPSEDEPPKEEGEEPKPEEEPAGEGEGEGDNENNAMWANRSNSRRRLLFQQQQQQQRNKMRRQPIPTGPPKYQQPRQQPQRQPLQQPQPPRQHQQRRGFNELHSLNNHQQQPLRQEAFHLTRPQQLPLPRRYGFTTTAAISGGELSSFLRRIQPLEGVLDWRGANSRGRATPLTSAAQPPPLPPQPTNSNSAMTVLPPLLAHVTPTARSYSATSRREILGLDEDDEDDVSLEAAASVDASEVQILQSNSINASSNRFNYDGCNCPSDAESVTCYLTKIDDDRGTSNTNGTGPAREFVPLVVGDWWACGGQRSLQLE